MVDAIFGEIYAVNHDQDWKSGRHRAGAVSSNAVVVGYAMVDAEIDCDLNCVCVHGVQHAQILAEEVAYRKVSNRVARLWTCYQRAYTADF
jgi:hypothetical protein